MLIKFATYLYFCFQYLLVVSQNQIFNLAVIMHNYIIDLYEHKIL